ncbi:hypothetical protein [Treponema sp. Marseille-Q4523]|uniref:flagellar biosynthesis protein FlhF n=1 Tax=Treponema sp. Marseille-Q4523 TaxID=2810610 RepID=UPI00196053C6|nr:hypothetical protein [Treponema sp. Marseille-Q4523]MBM7023374.1 hypothetical protein [Treponema sp. Marseille-Q4523]
MYSADRRDAPVLKMTGRTLDECKAKLFEKFNNEYTIRGKRTMLKGGFFGIGQKEVVEVSYTVDREDDVQKNTVARTTGISSRDGTDALDAAAAFNKTKDELLRAAQMTAFNTALNARMTQMEENFSKQLKSISFAASEKHPSIKKIESLLEENEFTFSYINEITEKLQSNFTLDSLDDFKAVERKVVDWIGKTISIAPEKIQRPPHVVVIVGPTGVGKTTTLVKLATKMVSEAKREERRIPSFAFITTDTMRVGAYEQLASYSTIFETELEKAETVEDLKKLYDEKRENLDAIFIDTSGYSPNDTENIGKMKAVLDVRGMKPDIYLAVAASTKAKDLANIMQNYEQFGYNSVIVTKCDESKQYGNIISVLHEKNKKISYIADGQKVVRDIHRADVVEFLIRLSGFDVDRVHIEDEFGE